MIIFQRRIYLFCVDVIRSYVHAKSAFELE